MTGPNTPSCFISYASGDLDLAAGLHRLFAAEGFRVWFDKVRLTPGCDWHKKIEAGCEAAQVILPLVTPRRAKSGWTRYETYAHDAVIPLLAVGKAIDVIPPPLRRWNAVSQEAGNLDELRVILGNAFSDQSFLGGTAALPGWRVPCQTGLKNECRRS